MPLIKHGAVLSNTCNINLGNTHLHNLRQPLTLDHLQLSQLHTSHILFNYNIKAITQTFCHPYSLSCSFQVTVLFEELQLNYQGGKKFPESCQWHFSGLSSIIIHCVPHKHSRTNKLTLNLFFYQGIAKSASQLI